MPVSGITNPIFTSRPAAAALVTVVELAAEVVVAEAAVVVGPAVVVVVLPPQAATRPPRPAPRPTVAPATPARRRKSRRLTALPCSRPSPSSLTECLSSCTALSPQSFLVLLREGPQTESPLSPWRRSPSSHVLQARDEQSHMHNLTSSAGADDGAREAGLILRLVEVGRIWLGLGRVPLAKGRRAGHSGRGEHLLVWAGRCGHASHSPRGRLSFLFGTIRLAPKPAVAKAGLPPAAGLCAPALGNHHFARLVIASQLCRSAPTSGITMTK